MAGLLDFLQAASNSAAGTVTAPVDGIAWLLRKAGIPVGEPVGGSDWAKRQGLMRDVPQSAASVAGETFGLLSPVVAAAKAPQIAKGLLQMSENAAAPRTLSGQSGVMRMADGRLSRAEFDEMTALIKNIESAAEKNGTVYVRWSPSAAGDLAPGAVSRDFVSGSTHNGLSAVPITGDMHPVDIAKSLREYGFLRMQDKRSMPRIYAGKQVGVDSDGYASIVPSEVLFELNKRQVSALDKKYADAVELMHRIELYKSRIDRGAVAWQDSLDKAAKELAGILGDK